MASKDAPGKDKREAITPPTCPYCQASSQLVGADVIYPHRPDLSHKRFYACAPCAAWVGCHDGTLVPLGRLANAELRKAKIAAHAAFDPLWQARRKWEGCSKTRARGAEYAWLATELGIDRRECHIGLFDVDLCIRTTEACRRRASRAAT